MVIRDRIIDFRRVRAGDLLPNPRNWRKHPQAQQDALRGILAEVGYVDALMARETPDGLMLIDGHLRAETTPDSEVPVLVVDLTDAEADLVLASFDPLSSMAEADAAQLDSLLREVETGSEALSKMLDELAKDAGCEWAKTPEIIEDEVPEPPADPITKSGDLWLLGEHRLLCGDSTKAEDVDRLIGECSINITFTSPPYAEQRKYDERSGFTPIAPDDYVQWWQAIQQNICNHLAADGSFFINIKPACEGLHRLLYVFDLVLAHVREWGWIFAEEFCWERIGIPQQVVRRFKNQFEPIYQFTRGPWKILPHAVQRESANVPQPIGKGAGDTNAAKRQGVKSAVDGNKIERGLAYPGNRLPTFSGSHDACGHGAAFPVGLPAWFFRAFSEEGDATFDPFCGSGSSLIAAEQTNRRAFAMELSPAYCDVIATRWESLTGRKAEQVEAAEAVA